MEGPTLKLSIERGPRMGETLEFKPRRVIRIGRVLRGNTLAIKDDGISSKHILIEFHDGRWVIKDLDSSNGTFLNGSRLPTLDPSYLRDGDVVKIGEATSMLVNVVDTPEDGDGEPPLPRKHPRRRAAAKTGGYVSENVGSVAETRGRKLGAKVSKEDDMGAAGDPLGLERERSGLAVGVGQDLKSADVVAGKDSNLRRQPRRRAVALKGEQEEGASQAQQVEVAIATGPDQGKQGQRVSPRRTRSSKKQQVLGSPASNQDTVNASKNLVKLEYPRTRAGRRRMENLKDELSQVIKISDSNNEESGKENPRLEASKEPLKTSGTKDSNDAAEDASVPDLEKMTLGEWFDYLEVALPRQICYETERMIEDLKQRAEQVSEYVAMQKGKREKALQVLHPSVDRVEHDQRNDQE